MRTVLRRGAATAVLMAFICGGVAVTPAMATDSEEVVVSVAEEGEAPAESIVESEPVETGNGSGESSGAVSDQENGSDAPVADDSALPGAEDADSSTGGLVPDVVAPPVAPLFGETVEDALEIPAAEEFDIVSVAITGAAQVGQTLTSAIEYSLTPDYIEFQWFADYLPITGADSENLVLTGDLIGATISFGVYAERDDFDQAAVAYSNELGPVTAAEETSETLEILSVVISGTPKVGQTLTSTVKFSHEPDYVGYVWVADGEIIEGAEGETLVLTKALIGKTIVLGVYAERDDFEEPAFDFSNEIGPVTAAAPVVVETPKPVEKVTEQVTHKTPAKKSPSAELAQTGANVSGAVVTGLFLMLLGVGGVWARRRSTQH